MLLPAQCRVNNVFVVIHVYDDQSYGDEWTITVCHLAYFIVWSISIKRSVIVSPHNPILRSKQCLVSNSIIKQALRQCLFNIILFILV